ncbi:MAG: ATP-binding cassette domain-containing protein [Ruminococcaceae bacterium]|nr:ATP-binding cassette domain-containing protein [Oscillospiraceae bacterium]
MVEVKNLVKNYGDIAAVKNISFTAEKGEILGFLGPNGAGKTTTMNIITGYLSATSGTVTIDGYDILDNPMEARSRIGYLPELPPLYLDMTVEKYLQFIYELKKVKLPKAEHLKEVMQLVKIYDIKDRVIRNLSKGYKQRVGFAQALVGNPPVLILDEPTVGLDPRQIIEMRSIIKSLGKKHTVIFSSHVLSEVSEICDRIVVISNGQITADAKTDELSNITEDTKKLSLTVDGVSATVLSVLGDVDGVTKVRRVSQESDTVYQYMVEYKKDKDIRRAVFRTLAKADCPILEMKDAGMSLEESFLQLTGSTKVERTKKGGKA